MNDNGKICANHDNQFNQRSIQKINRMQIIMIKLIYLPLFLRAKLLREKLFFIKR